MKKLMRIIRKLFLPLIWLAIGTALILLMGAARDNQHAAICQSMQIRIDTRSENSFVSQKDVKELLWSNQISVVGKLLMEIDLQHIEDVLGQNQFIENAEAYITTGSELMIEIYQREPLLRVINKKGVSYYIDKRGSRMPFSFKFAARVLVATGDIDCSKADKQICKNLYVLSKYISENEFWDALIEQIVVNRKGEFELIPHLGNHRVILGSLEKMEIKFDKLLKFYNEGLNNVGWYKYKTINLKYKDQIVCTKY